MFLFDINIDKYKKKAFNKTLNKNNNFNCNYYEKLNLEKSWGCIKGQRKIN